MNDADLVAWLTEALGRKPGDLAPYVRALTHGSQAVENYERLEFLGDRVLGLSRLRAIHLNDSKNPMGSRKDRHEQIGKGSLGLDAIEAIINHPALRNLPFYLETPNEPEGYAREIALLRGLYKGE